MRFFLLSILFLSLIACTEAKVGMDDLNLKYSKFSVFQYGQETNFVRVNAQSLVASYQLSCNANAAQLYLRWGDSGDWTLVTSLTPENDKCSLTHALTPPPTKSWPVIEAQLKIADTKGRETEVRSVEFITPSFASD